VFASALRMSLNHYYLTFNVSRSAFGMLYSKYRKPSYLNLQVFETSISFSMHFATKTVHCSSVLVVTLPYVGCSIQNASQQIVDSPHIRTVIRGVNVGNPLTPTTDPSTRCCIIAREKLWRSFAMLKYKFPSFYFKLCKK
jgi:hypothetical protein